MNSSRPKIVMFNPLASPKMPYDGPPLSILAAVCMVDLEKFDVKVIDWHYKDFEKRLAAECADAMVFGVTCMTGYQIGTMLAAARLAKQVNPSIVVVCGGSHPTLMPEQTLENPLIDCVVIGQGPRTFKNLVERLAEGKSPEGVPGVGFKKDGRIVINEAAQREDINNFPRYPYHLLDNYEDYLVTTRFAKRAAYMLTSEGCPSNCSFCGEAALYKRRWIALKVDRVMDELAELKQRYNIDGVVIADSNFFVDERRVAEFCRRLIPLGITWGGTSARSDQLRRYKDETLQLMKDSGLDGIFLGVESASDETLKVMNKGAVISDTVVALQRAKKFGFDMQCSFVVGVPGIDVEKDFKNTMKFINDLRRQELASQFHVFIYTPLPGTPFLPAAVQQGYTVPAKLEDWISYEFHAHSPPWVPKKYAGITDQLSVYFMFLSGNARTVVRSVAPRRLMGLALLAERVVYHLSAFRVQHGFYSLPIEFKVAKFVLLHKSLFFGDKKLLF